MTSPDDEFDDFLRRRRPVFGRDDELEPPLELDRVVLRQAREAIEGERRPHRMFRAPSWGMPVALAATLVLAFTVILRVSAPGAAKKPEVTVQNVSRQVASPETAAAPAVAPAPALARPAAEAADAAAPADAPPAVESDGSAVVVDLGSARDKMEAPRVAEQRARRADTVASNAAAGAVAAARAEAATAATEATAAVPKPQYRRDSKSWLAEIERLRAAGENARADAELTEYKREHRAYAGAPDR